MADADLYTFFCFFLCLPLFYDITNGQKKRQSADLCYPLSLSNTLYGPRPIMANAVLQTFFFFFFLLSMAHGQNPAKCLSLYIFPLFIIIFFFYYLWPTAKNRQSAYLYISFPSFFTIYGPRPKTGKVPISIFFFSLFFFFFLLSMAHDQKPAKCLSLYFFSFFFFFFFFIRHNHMHE